MNTPSVEINLFSRAQGENINKHKKHTQLIPDNWG